MRLLTSHALCTVKSSFIVKYMDQTMSHKLMAVIDFKEIMAVLFNRNIYSVMFWFQIVCLFFYV